METRSARWLQRSTATAVIGLTCALSTGCYKATFIDPNAIAGEEHDEWTDFFLFGLVGEEERDVREFCQGPVALVRTGSNFGTGIVSLLTLFIYTPRKVYVTCAAGSSVPHPAARVEAPPLTIEERDGQPVRVRATTASGESVGVPEAVDGAPGMWRVRVKKGAAL